MTDRAIDVLREMLTSLQDFTGVRVDLIDRARKVIAEAEKGGEEQKSIHAKTPCCDVPVRLTVHDGMKWKRECNRCGNRYKVTCRTRSVDEEYEHYEMDWLFVGRETVAPSDSAGAEEWISVKERLPERDGDRNSFGQVLVYDGEDMTVAAYFDCHWVHDGKVSRPLNDGEASAPHFHRGGVGPTVQGVTHWKRLPEPPPDRTVAAPSESAPAEEATGECVACGLAANEVRDGKPICTGCRVRTAAPADPQPERITGPAILGPDDVVCSMPIPASHYAVAQHFREYEGLLKDPSNQGFVTSSGRFVGRKEARRIAEDAGQIVNPITGGPALFSEELWTPQPEAPSVPEREHMHDSTCTYHDAQGVERCTYGPTARQVAEGVADRGL